MLTATSSDLPAFLASLDALGARLQDALGEGLKDWADDVLEAANAEGVVPYQSGELHDSGYTEGPLTGAGKSSVRIGYGVEYALRVHEEPQSARKTGRSKWLEQTITGKAGDLAPKLKARLP